MVAEGAQHTADTMGRSNGEGGGGGRVVKYGRHGGVRDSRPPNAAMPGKAWRAMTLAAPSSTRGTLRPGP